MRLATTAGRLCILAGSMTLAGCSRNPPLLAPSTLESISFSASTGSDTLLEGTFAGTAVIRGGWISVAVVPTISFPAGPRERWRSVTIRSFLAADYGRGTWKAPVASTAINVWRFLNFPPGSLVQGRTPVAFKDTLRFTVAIPPGTSLATSRLGFELEWVTVFQGYGQTEQNYAFSGPLPAARPPSP